MTPARTGERRSVALFLALLLASLFAPAATPGGPFAVAAQVVEPERGVAGTVLRLRQLDGVKRVLLVGAHPDDEDTSLIAALARGWGAEVAYLSLTRGEGGQNLIGPELREGLGLVRTGELLAARELDGGVQFFGREFDFGYSKTAEETFGNWPREEVVADVVWTIRRFRPQVVVSVFPPDERAGHGHHQAAGIATYEAFEAAGDPERFPEQLTGADAVEPWAPAKLYRSARFDPDAATSEIRTGVLDPVLGRSHVQLAMESRSRHRSQDMGTAQPLGPEAAELRLVRRRAAGGTGDDDGIFAGVDTALVSVASEMQVSAADGSAVEAAIEEYRSALRSAGSRLHPDRPEEAVPALARAVTAMERALEAAGGDPAAVRVLEPKLRSVREALLSAAGVVVEVRTDDDLVVPGQDVEVEVVVWNGGFADVTRADPELLLPEAWAAEILGPPEDRGGFLFRGPDPESYRRGTASVPAGSIARWRYRVRVPPDADVSKPYFHVRPRDGAMYRWPEDRSLWGLPRNPPVLEGRVALRLAVEASDDAADGAPDDASAAGGGASGLDLRVRRAAEYVGVHRATGEFRAPLMVVPAVSVTVQPEVVAWPLDRDEPRSVTVAVRSEANDGFHGRVDLEAPSGWTVAPSGGHTVELDGAGRERSLTFRVRPADAEPGRYTLQALAEADDGRRYAEGFEPIDYPHIRPDLLFRAAESLVSAFPVRVEPDLRVGYVMGSGDSGPDALDQLGVDVELLSPDAVREGAFDGYDVVVVGVRAYETREDLRGANEQLLDWVRDGGTVLVQYNQYEFSGGGYAPYPLRIRRPHDRVTDETAAVRMLDPTSPVFTEPNRITAGDFEGWIQERGLYFAGEWADTYTPLLEMADLGEDPARGSLLVAPLGDGLWVYTGLAFFRQFPAGVPGAYRLFANLVSLDAEEWRAHHGDGGDG